MLINRNLGSGVHFKKTEDIFEKNGEVNILTYGDDVFNIAVLVDWEILVRVSYAVLIVLSTGKEGGRQWTICTKKSFTEI